MGFVEHLQTSVRMMTFDRNAIEEVSDEQGGTVYGFIVLAIAGIASATTFNFRQVGIRMGTLFFIIAIGLLFYQLIGKRLLEKKATGVQYFRYMSNSAVIYWFTFIPTIGIPLQIFAGSWMMIINIYILTSVHKLSNWKAIITGGLMPLVFLTISVTVNSLHLFF